MCGRCGGTKLSASYASCLRSCISLRRHVSCSPFWRGNAKAASGLKLRDSERYTQPGGLSPIDLSGLCDPLGN